MSAGDTAPIHTGDDDASVASCPGWGGGGVGDGGGTGGDGGGSGTNPPPAKAAEDTCNTGDPLIDDLDVQKGFADLWRRSNYGLTVPHEERVEQGGWIMQDANGGYSFQAWPALWPSTPCGIDIPLTTVPPPGAVGWVHTHPYANGEKLTECDQQELPGIGRVPITYRNKSSEDDDYVQSTWAAHGYQVRAYIVDADRIVQYDGSGQPAGDTPHARCGY